MVSPIAFIPRTNIFGLSFGRPDFWPMGIGAGEPCAIESADGRRRFEFAWDSNHRLVQVEDFGPPSQLFCRTIYRWADDNTIARIEVDQSSKDESKRGPDGTPEHALVWTWDNALPIEVQSISAGWRDACLLEQPRITTSKDWDWSPDRRSVRITESSSSENKVLGVRTAHFDAAGRLVRFQVLPAGTTTRTGTCEITWSPDGRMLSARWIPAGDTRDCELTFDWDEKGRLVGQSDVHGQRWVYQYGTRKVVPVPRPPIFGPRYQRAQRLREAVFRWLLVGPWPAEEFWLPPNARNRDRRHVEWMAAAGVRPEAFDRPRVFDLKTIKEHAAAVGSALARWMRQFDRKKIAKDWQGTFGPAVSQIRAWLKHRVNVIETAFEDIQIDPIDAIWYDNAEVLHIDGQRLRWFMLMETGCALHLRLRSHRRYPLERAELDELDLAQIPDEEGPGRTLWDLMMKNTFGADHTDGLLRAHARATLADPNIGRVWHAREFKLLKKIASQIKTQAKRALVEMESGSMRTPH